MPKSRFFRVAVEGATTDGRAIDRQWLLDAAQTYNPATFAARINVEHVRGMTGDPPFLSMGDVLSLRTQDVQIDVGGKTETRLALFAEIEALEPLVQLNQRGQKLFTSIEINPNFAGTGKAYLVGLAVTDSPASLGTEMLKFAASQGENSPLRSRKQHADNLFSAAEEFQLELADDTADPAHGLMAKIAAFFNGPAATLAASAPVPAQPAPAVAAAPAPAPDTSAAFNQAMIESITKMASIFETFARASTERAAAFEAQLGQITATLEATPAVAFAQRQLATGGDGSIRTDC